METNSVRDEKAGKVKTNLEAFLLVSCLVVLVIWSNIQFSTQNLRDLGNENVRTKIQALDLTVSGKREKEEIWKKMNENTLE